MSSFWRSSWMNSANERWKKHHGVTGRHVRARTAFRATWLWRRQRLCVPPVAGLGGSGVRGSFRPTTQPARRDQQRPLVSTGLHLHRQRTLECAHMWLPCQHPNLMQSSPPPPGDLVSSTPPTEGRSPRRCHTFQSS